MKKAALLYFVKIVSGGKGGSGGNGSDIHWRVDNTSDISYNAGPSGSDGTDGTDQYKQEA